MTPGVSISAPRPLLGISAKSRDMLESPKRRQIDPTAGLDGRKSRLDLTRASGSFLYDAKKQAADQTRVVWCHRGVQTRSGEAGIYRRLDGGGARMTGIIRCGSVWTCPTCALPVSEKRREELAAGMVEWTNSGGHVYLMTLTFPHERTDELSTLMVKLTKALTRFRTGRAYRGVRDRFGVVGAVRALEATHGQNGWHPHLHFLVFGKPGLLDDDEARDTLRNAWLQCLDKAGLLPANKAEDAALHSFDIRGGDQAADYISKFGRDQKFGMSSEVTRHMAKVGARGLAEFSGHVTPFQILEWAAKGDTLAVSLWREFAPVFTGKRQLVYTAGLKKKLGIDDLTDDEIANDDSERPAEEMVGNMTGAQLAILHSRRALGEFLDNVARYGGGQNDIDDWIAFIEQRPKVSSGTLIDRGEFVKWPQAA